MPDGFPNTYFKTAPLGFGTTVFDCDDLSITRGSSLTLLAMPGLLAKHLATAFPALDFKWIQFSASELVFGCTVANPGSGTLTLTPEPGGQDRWRRTLLTYAQQVSGQVTDDSLKNLSRRALIPAGLTPDATMIEMTARQILSMLSEEQLLGGLENARLPADICTEISNEIKDFTSSDQGIWPFDLMLFATVWYQPDGPNAAPADIFAVLDTRLGHARMHQPSCVMPQVADIGTLSAKEAVCGFTGILAALPGQQKKGRAISGNAARRRKVGRNQKKGFYAGILADAVKAAKGWDGNDLVTEALAAIDEAIGKVGAFANDFSDIVNDAPAGLPKSVQGNICVLNMDGNGFGALRAGMTNLKEYQRFSEYLDILKAGMLARILIWVADENNGMLHDGEARFETLLWGGDEFTFVLPAWKGWELAALIHAAVKGWKTLPSHNMTQNMTFATGLVFGPHKAPIRDLKTAAEDLVEMAKSDRSKAVWQALAYESVDRVHFSPEGYRRDWLGKAIADEHFNLPAEMAINLPGFIAQDMLPTLSRTQLHRIYYDRVDWLGCARADTGEIADQIKHVAPAMPDDALNKVLETLLPDGDYPMLRFAQLNLLFDYIQPEAGRG